VATSGVTGTGSQIDVNQNKAIYPSDTTIYYHANQINSSTMITAGNGWPVWQATYLPYGEEYNPQIGDEHYKFTSKERDGETGLDYFGARYYSSSLGHFATADWAEKPEAVPYSDLDDPQSLNLYSYVRNLPTTKTDATGHCLEDACIGEAYLAVALVTTVSSYLASPSGQHALSAVGEAIGSLFSRSNNSPPPSTTTTTQTGAPGTTTTTVQTGAPGTTTATAQTTTPASTSQAGTVNTSPLASSKSTTPVGQTSSGQKINAYGEKLGPSGKPMRHTARHSTRKAAKDAARQEGETTPVEHGGDGHFHPTDQDGNKIPNSTHHEYPH
jgi:RHS repeat-associated protein